LRALPVLSFQRPAERIRYRNGCAGAKVKTNETDFSKRYQLPGPCYAVKNSKAVWAFLADVAFNAKGVEHETLALGGDDRVPRDDTCLPITQVESKHSSQLCCGEVLSKSIALSSCLGLE
jgi:hypothetical protein